MKTQHIILCIICLIKFTLSTHCTEESSILLTTLSPSKFSISPDNEACFKFKLGEKKGPLGISFTIANLFTAEVTIYSSLNEKSLVNYTLAESEFKEIDTSEFDDYVYIVIKDRLNLYYYSDYITLYDGNEIINLKEGEPIIMKNFLSNNIYQMTYSSSKEMELVYNANNENFQKKISITFEGEKILDHGNESQYIFELTPSDLEKESKITISVESDYEKDPNPEFSLIIYDKDNSDGFKKVKKGEEIETKYIYYNGTQKFYYYADVSDYQNSCTLNFKLHYHIKKNETNNTHILSDIIYSDEEIKEEDLIKYVPKENKMPNMFDIGSDEYYKIYFSPENKGKKIYIIVAFEICQVTYFIRNRFISVSLGDEVEDIKTEDLEYNKALTIAKNTKDYLPTYFKLLLDPNSKYMLTSQNQDHTQFVKGDLLLENKTINKNYLNDTRDIIILSNIDEFTVRIFGYAINATFYLEKINNDTTYTLENIRNNDVISVSFDENECKNNQLKYVVGTYSKELYTNGLYKINYYAIKESGEMDLFYKNKINLEGESIFPLDEKEKKPFNRIFILQDNLDLFTIKCNKPGTMFIRPQRKKYDGITSHLIRQNSIQDITIKDYDEIIQLSSPINPSPDQKMVYFSIISLDGQEITISPDTPNVFPAKKIKDNELFTGSIALTKYKMDEIAVKINSHLTTNIEVIEVIPGKYTTYNTIKEGDNKKITYNNVYLKIDNTVPKMKLKVNQLQNKKISYGVANLAYDDKNYIPLAYNIKDTITKEIKNNEETIEFDNIYYNKNNSYKPYLMFVMSVLGNQENLEYDLDIERIDSDNFDGNKIILIVAFIIIGTFALLIIIFVIYCLIRKKHKSLSDEEEEINKASKLVETSGEQKE